MGNPFLGVFFHWLGGLASGSFYVPYRGVKKWSWETYWLVGGFFSWIICPWVFALSHDERRVRRAAPAIRQHALVDVFLRRDVGLRRPDVRSDDALSRHVAGHGRGARLLRGVRHAGAADLQAVHAEPAGRFEHFGNRQFHARPGHARGRGGVSARHRHRGAGRFDEGKGNAGGAKENGDQGIQFQEGHSGRHVFRHHERLFFVRADGGQSHR